MQYLSKAYSYYSGINPATLSGAIDVIVIKHVDDHGKVTLSSSPFHVRFGKLQVLRAAEKRVTVRLPNNLPAPHIAPFSMKVGETGEAFFVLETDEEVPEDLMTSPVVMPVQGPDGVADDFREEPRPQTHSLTQQPFGETEEIVDHASEVEFLDLNAPLSAGSSSKGRDRPPSDSVNRMPNPMEAGPGESAQLPARDRRLSDRDRGADLPKVRPGDGDGPEVVYGKDVVLDMAGYHSKTSIELERKAEHQAETHSLLNDLLAAIQPDQRPALKPRNTDPPEDALSALSLEPRRSDRASSEPPDINNNEEAARLKNVDADPYIFVLERVGTRHSFELALIDDISDSNFDANRVTFQRFIEDPALVDDPRLVLRYHSRYLTWAKDYDVMYGLAIYRRSLAPTNSDGPRAGYGWSRWWRRGQTTDLPLEPPKQEPPEQPLPSAKHYAKTLRLSSEQLSELCLKPGPNTIQFSVTSSYSGQAVCAARIFLWDASDQIVISDIDGTITKSDALGHVFAAIGRDWTHLGIAKLYTDIANNGYKMLYLTSRAIGQADSTREYLRSITQGEYRLPEGPVIMSPDRLMASLHREVVMRKPELFKMACLRDIQRLFGEQSKDAFFAGFGNRITDAMSYRSVGIEAAKIYTIDSTGVVKTELLQSAGHKGSYILLNDLVNETFPPVDTKVKPEYSDFNYWRSSISDFPIPDLAPPSPALSARSDTSGRLSVLGRVLGRRSSRPALPQQEPSSRPTSPLIGAVTTSDDLSDYGSHSRSSSMPGSFEEEPGGYFPVSFRREEEPETEGDMYAEPEGEEEEDNFDDDLLATGEMQNVPF